MSSTPPDSAVVPPQPGLGVGEVRHTRVRPVRHAFRYRTWFWLLPLRQLRASGWQGVRRNRWGPSAFYDADHGTGQGDALGWFEQVLHQLDVTDAEGEIWLQTYPRVWGYVFKPVSFWYVHSASGALRGVLAEVNNTFGERHLYWLDGPDLGWGRELRATKALHVSPFTQVVGEYRFRFLRSGAGAADERLVARVEHWDEQGAVLLTSISGRIRPLTRAASAKVHLTMPGMTLAIMARIHWQALALWLKRVPFYRQPPAPDHFLSHGGVVSTPPSRKRPPQ